MVSLQNFSIKTKIFVAFALVLLGTALLGAISVQRLSAVNDAAAEIRNNWLPSTGILGELSATSERYRIAEANTVLQVIDTGTLSKAMSDNLRVALETRDKSWARYQPMISPGAERDLADRIGATWAAYLQDSRKLADLLASGNKIDALHFYSGPMRDDFFKLRNLLADDVTLNTRNGIEAADRGAEVYRQTRWLVIAAVVAEALLCVAIGYGISFSVSRPLSLMTAIMARLARHDLGVEITGMHRRDEIGHMAAAVQVFKENMIEADRLTALQQAEQARKEQRQRKIDSQIAKFDTSVQDALGKLSTASTEMRVTAQSMAATAEETSRQATVVAAAAEQASTNVQTVAAATEQVAASINEISRQVVQSKQVTASAVGEAAETRIKVDSLNATAFKIGEVVKLIGAIAHQTNLLALNATIEAARAGDAGKGFAVVASEVKNLANQTASATGEISDQIAEMQSVTSVAVAAMRNIDQKISEISEIAIAISSAIEEQSTAAREISRNTEEAANGTQEVSANIVGVNQAAQETGSAAAQVLSSSTELGGQWETLRSEVAQFLSDIQAA